MNNNGLTYRKRLSLQGFGLSFLLSSILFLLTGHLLSFSVILLGLVGGFSLGTLLDNRQIEKQFPSRPRQARSASSIARLFLHPSLPVRFLSLFTSGVVLFVATWYVAFHLLPDQFLFVASPLHDTVGASVVAEMAQIAAYNLIWIVLIALIGVFLPQYPFAYLIPLVWVIYYALLLGTNSFAIPMAERMAPSLAVFQRAGPFEMTAYLLAAAASFSPARSTVANLKEALSTPLGRSQWLGLILAALLILAAALREAIMILQR